MPEISPALFRAGSGEPVVLLHGFTGTWHHWRPVLGDLVARYEVIAPTLAGHAGGPPLQVTTESAISHAADHLEGHLDDLGVGTAHFVGNSMGGALSLELAKRGRARSVVALSPGGLWAIGGPEPARIAAFFARQVRLTKASAARAHLIVKRPGARHLAFRDIMRFGELVSPADAADLMRTSVQCTVVDQVIQALRAGQAHLEGLEQIDAPVRVAWAQMDRILPMALHAGRARREIRGVDYVVMPKVGHVPMWDDTRLVVRTITEFVDRHVTGEAATATTATAGRSSAGRSRSSSSPMAPTASFPLEDDMFA
ncbi:MAG: alpha/beta hydrolase [Solirubrobacterales bacterium]|jgi:pimeloyl-ACP methyl ester carboxylesterase|nr:alpha/beta hydrolase [Solirubrobacterales bacterium]